MAYGLLMIFGDELEIVGHECIRRMHLSKVLPQRTSNVTFTDSMAIHKGGREVQLHFFGRGHTGGDR